MAVVGVISAVDDPSNDSVVGWTRDLFGMLYRIGVEALVVDPWGNLTKALLDPIELDEWQKDRHATLADLYAGQVVEPVVLSGRYAGAKLMPPRRSSWTMVAAQAESLGDWLRDRTEPLSLVLLGGTPAFALAQACTHLIVVTRLDIGSLRALRSGGERLRSVIAAPIAYSVIDPPGYRSREDQHNIEYVRSRIPGVFRTAWLGQGDLTGFDPVADAQSIGLLRDRSMHPRPAFELTPLDGLGDTAVRQAKSEAHELAQRLLSFLGLDAPDGIAEVALEPASDAQARVTRLLGPTNGPPVEGFLEADHAGVETIEAFVEAVRVGVIEGESGVGKTFVSKTLGGTPVWHRVPLRDEDDIDEALRGVPDGVGVILDELDECAAARQRAFARSVANWLGVQPPDRKLLVFSRPYGQLDTFVGELCRAIGGVKRRVLLPLRDAEVRALVAARLPDRTWAFMDEVRRFGLATLAARPLTLETLIAHYLDKQRLTASREALFQTFTRQLAGYKGDANQVLNVARPLSWVIVVGDRGGPSGVDRDGFLDLFNVKRADFEAALASPIFAGGHRSVWEYLAARWALDEQLPRERLAQHLLHERYVPEHLSAVVRWLVEADADFAALILRADPEQLLNLGARVDASLRLSWLRALVERHRAGEVDLSQVGVGLLVDTTEVTIDQAARLFAEARALLGDADPAVRQVAIPFLRFGGEEGVELLVRIIADGAGERRPRLLAIWALQEIDVTAYADTLRAVWFSDSDDRLRGNLLPLLWPHHLRAVEVIRSLPRARWSTWSLVHGGKDPTARLSIDELSEALEAIAAGAWRRSDRLLFSRGGIVERLTQRAVDLIDHRIVRVALARLVLAWPNHTVRLRDVTADWHADMGLFWRLVEAVVIEADDANFENFARHFPLRLDDQGVESAVSALERDADLGLHKRWVQLLLRRYGWPEQFWGRLEELGRLHPELLERLNRLRSPPARAESEVEDEAEAETEAEPEQLTFLEELRQFLRLTDQGERPWLVIASIDAEFSARFGLKHVAIQLSPLFERLTNVEQASVVGSAIAFVENPHCSALLLLDGWIYGEQVADLGASAWRCVRLAGHEPGDGALMTWLPLILRDGARTGFPTVEEVIARQGEAWLDDLGTLLDELGDCAPLAFDQLEACWRPRIERLAFEHLRPVEAGARDESMHRQLLDLLLRQSPERAWTWILDHQGVDWPVDVGLERAPQATWERIWPKFSTDEVFARRMIERLGGHHRVHWWDAGDNARLEEIYRWLWRVFPSVEVPGDIAEGRVLRASTPADWAEQCRSAIAFALVQRGAVEQVEALAADFGWSVATVAETRRNRHRTPPTLEDLRRASPRLDSTNDLLWLLVDTLATIQREDLDGEHTVREAFFNPVARCEAGATERKLRRCHETRACQLLAKLIALRLPRDQVSITLEPQESEARQRIDLHVFKGGHRVKIEVKWADNDSVKTALEAQLFERYLRGKDAAGIYLVLWYAPTDVVQAKDVDKAWREDPLELEKLLRAQADRVGQIEPVVLRMR